MKVAQHALTFDWYDPNLLQTDQANQLVDQVNESLSKLVEKMGTDWKEKLEENHYQNVESRHF